MSSTPGRTLTSMHRILLALLGWGLVSVAIELLLLGHDEDSKQLIPLSSPGSRRAPPALAPGALVQGRPPGATQVARLWRYVVIEPAR